MVDFNKMSVVDLVQHIRPIPHMYFGPKLQLSALADMLWGFNLNAQTESAVPYQYFNHWVKWKLDKFGPRHNWASAIIEVCNHDEEKAFWKFYDLLDEFMQLRPQKVWVAELSNENLAYYYFHQNEMLNKHGSHTFTVEQAPYLIKAFDLGYCVHTYHFDYHWLVKEYDQNLYYRHFGSMEECKTRYTEKFQSISWNQIMDDEVETEFRETIHHCRNRRKNII